MLTLREPWLFGSDGTNAELGKIPMSYEVLGLPKGQQAWIATGNRFWQIQHVKDGIESESSGIYASKEDALAAISTV